MKRLKNCVWWLVWNTAFAACLWAGFEHEVEGARSVAEFYVWLMLVVGLLVVIGDATPKKAPEKGFPRELAVPFYIAAVVFLVWHGQWGDGIALTLGVLCAFAAGDNARKKWAEAQA